MTVGQTGRSRAAAMDPARSGPPPPPHPHLFQYIK